MIDRRSFLGSTAAAAVVAALDGGPAFGTDFTAAAHKQVLQARGLEIVEGDKPVRLRGVNLGGWMLIEDYMIGLPWTEWRIREQFRKVLGADAYAAFFDAYMDSYVAEADIAFLARSGFNFVRLPFNYRHFESDMAPGVWLEEGFRRLESAVALCRKHGIWVLLDLHAAPGAQARDQNAGSAFGEVYFWYYKQFLDRATALWKEIARRYRNDPTIAGYNLLCEPVTSDVGVLNAFYLNTIRAIRQVDPHHIVALDPNLWARDIDSLHDDLFADPQVIAALHHYYTDSEAFASLKSYPGVSKGVVCDRAALADTLKGKYDLKRIRRPVVAAEFGVFRDSLQEFAVQLAITKDLVSIFEEKGWGWAMWCYKDLKSMGFVTPRADTPWRKFLDEPEVTRLIASYRELEKPFVESVDRLLGTTDVDGDIRAQWAREVSRDFDVPALDFVLRRLAKHSHEELAAMGRSFAFDSCEIHKDQLGALADALAAPQPRAQ
jgi:hypothetical protein